ncbi:MAG TPA: tRNA (adenosine(37)-N6)-threonylcarbamoyltransferase complex transferase subunit TsaD [Ignavibacteria bacterium]|nr:tRNA (adenosine(37)-N6)-threonylcarbamoyltransferase complex transferase subunit TsaD [Ignavibacteria bacterium]
MRILAIETSCDETSVSILENKKILSNVISSQLFHSEWGGVVPEIASREHLKNIVLVTNKALNKAQVSMNDIEIVAAASEPGLIGALLVGLNYAKAIAVSKNIPFVPVNHIQAHLYSPFIEHNIEFPYLCLIVSGGHTLLVKVDDFFQHTILGTTLDDAAGEAFDKGAKMLGLGYPGGPMIDKLAKTGDKNFHKFPISVTKDNEFDFSFSGIKTALMYYLKKLRDEDKDETFLNDICASYQEAIVKMLFNKTLSAAKEYKIKNIAIAGGVSANSRLKEKFDELNKSGYNVQIPSIQFTMDNAAMIGITAYFRYENSKNKSYFYRESLNHSAKARLDYVNF